MTTRDHTQSGLGLVETLIAVFMFAILSVGLLSLVVVMVRTALNSERQVVALALASEQIEIIRSKNFADVCTVKQDTGDGRCKLPDDSTNTIELRNNQPYRLSVEVTDLGSTAAYKKVDVLVAWDAPGDALRDIRLVTYATDMNVGGDEQSGDPDTAVSGNVNFEDSPLDAVLYGSSRTEQFTISNNGTSDLILTGSPPVFLTNLFASQYTITGQPGTTIPPGSSETLTIKYHPTSTLSYEHVANVNIASNDPDTDVYQLVLRGRATAGPFPALDFTATVLGSGEVYEGNGTYSVPSGSNVRLSWTSSGSQFCNDWIDNSRLARTQTLAITTDRTFVVACTHVPNGTVIRTIKIVVGASPE